MKDDKTLRQEQELVTPFAVSFTEYLSKICLPVIELTCNGKELLFILDTGSDGSHINRSVVEELSQETFSIAPREGKLSVISTGNGIAKASDERSGSRHTRRRFPQSQQLDNRFRKQYGLPGVQIKAIANMNIDYMLDTIRRNGFSPELVDSYHDGTRQIP